MPTPPKPAHRRSVSLPAGQIYLHDLSAKANHRIPFQDALIAATAANKDLTVLHYDGHFDILNKVLGFEHRWVAAPGSLKKV